MEILSEIIEISDKMIDTLDGSGFFLGNPFIQRIPLKRKLQIAMQRKWEQESDMLLTDTEFIKVCKETVEESVASTIESLVDKGALEMSIGSSGEIQYSAKKDFDLNDL